VLIPEPATTPRPARPVVFLVHGFLRTGASMAPMRWALQRRGFQAVAVTQPNLVPDIPALADDLASKVQAARARLAGPDGALPDAHFVTHSMGGIVVRQLLATRSLAGPNRIVMLAPPNQGSAVAEHWRDRVLKLPWGTLDPLGKLLPGDRGQCAPIPLPDPDACFGVIAGAASDAESPWARLSVRVRFSTPPRRPHDGTVSLDEARWDGASDFLVVPHGHSFMMGRKDVIEQTAHFLAHGRFRRDD
jgi:pimeloyl-ACP methyl ester carboxylesterase